MKPAAKEAETIAAEKSACSVYSSFADYRWSDFLFGRGGRAKEAKTAKLTAFQ